MIIAMRRRSLNANAKQTPLRRGHRDAKLMFQLDLAHRSLIAGRIGMLDASGVRRGQADANSTRDNARGILGLQPEPFGARTFFHVIALERVVGDCLFFSAAPEDAP